MLGVFSRRESDEDTQPLTRPSLRQSTPASRTSKRWFARVAELKLFRWKHIKNVEDDGFDCRTLRTVIVLFISSLLGNVAHTIASVLQTENQKVELLQSLLPLVSTATWTSVCLLVSVFGEYRSAVEDHSGLVVCMITIPAYLSPGVLICLLWINGYPWLAYIFPSACIVMQLSCTASYLAHLRTASREAQIHEPEVEMSLGDSIRNIFDLNFN